MGELKTIRVPEEDFNDAKQVKEELDISWGDYVSPHRWHSVFSNLDAIPAESAAVEQNSELDYGHIREIVREEVRQALEEVVR